MPSHRPRMTLAGLLTRQSSLPWSASAIMAGLTLAAGLGALRQVLFNAEFGTGPEARAYHAAMVLPGVIFAVAGGSAVSNAMIPILTRTQAEGVAGTWRLTSLVLSTLTAVVAVIALVAGLCAPAIVTGVLAPGFDPQTSDLTVILVRLMLLQPVLMAVGAVATAVLHSRNQFLLTSLSLAASNIAIIAGVVATRLHPPLGIYGPSLGVVGGALLTVLVLLPGLRAAAFRFRLAWDLGDGRLHEVVRLLVPNCLVLALMYSVGIVETSFASRAREAAALPALHSAWMLSTFTTAVVGQAIGHAALPRLAASAAAGEWERMGATVLRALAAAFGLALPVQLGVFLIGRPVVHLLFEHGRFDAAAAELTYAVLATYMIGLPAYAAIELLMRGLIALYDTRTLVLAKAAHLGLVVMLISVLLDQHGVIALPLAAVVASATEALGLGAVLLIRLRRRRSGAQKDDAVLGRERHAADEGAVVDRRHLSAPDLPKGAAEGDALR